MKDENGGITTFDESKQESDESEETTADKEPTSKIESEDTLKMIKDALKSAPKKKKKVATSVMKKKVSKVEKPQDSI